MAMLNASLVLPETNSTVKSSSSTVTASGALVVSTPLTSTDGAQNGSNNRRNLTAIHGQRNHNPSDSDRKNLNQYLAKNENFTNSNDNVTDLAEYLHDEIASIETAGNTTNKIGFSDHLNRTENTITGEQNFTQAISNFTDSVTESLVNITTELLTNNLTDNYPNQTSVSLNGVGNVTVPTILLDGYVNNLTSNARDYSDYSSNVSVLNQTVSNLTVGIHQRHRIGENYVISLQYYLGEMIVVVILLGILTCWTMFGNLLVLIALGKFKNLKTMSNYLIGNLALCDFLLALTVLPLSLVNDVLGHWIFGEVICNLWLSIDVLYCTASIWSLCVIALDRFTATSFPVWYREKRSIKRASIYITLVWVFSIIVTVPPLFGWQDKSLNYQFNNSTQKYECILFSNVEYVIYSAMGSFIIPLFLMVLLYVKIFIVIRKRSKQLHRTYMKNHQNRRGGSKKASIAQTSQKVQPPQAIELNTISKVQNTKPDDSKLLFSYSTDSSPDVDIKSDDEDEDDLSSDGVTNSQGYYSEKDTCTTLLRQELRNGVMSTTEATDSDTLVITNPSSKFTGETTDKESQSDQEKVTLMTKPEKQSSGPRRNPLSDQNKNNQVPGEHDGGTTTEDEEGKKKKPANLPPKGNPFKRDRLRSSFRKFDKREQRATKRMGMIISCFFICWMPFTIMYLTRSLCANCQELNPNLLAFIIWLGYANSGLNPLLYTIFNEDFRRAFYRMLGARAPTWFRPWGLCKRSIGMAVTPQQTGWSQIQIPFIDSTIKAQREKERILNVHPQRMFYGVALLAIMVSKFIQSKRSLMTMTSKSWWPYVETLSPWLVTLIVTVICVAAIGDHFYISIKADTYTTLKQCNWLNTGTAVLVDLLVSYLIYFIPTLVMYSILFTSTSVIHVRDDLRYPTDEELLDENRPQSQDSCYGSEINTSPNSKKGSAKSNRTRVSSGAASRSSSYRYQTPAPDKPPLPSNEIIDQLRPVSGKKNRLPKLEQEWPTINSFAYNNLSQQNMTQARPVTARLQNRLIIAESDENIDTIVAKHGQSSNGVVQNIKVNNFVRQKLKAVNSVVGICVAPRPHTRQSTLKTIIDSDREDEESETVLDTPPSREGNRSESRAISRTSSRNQIVTTPREDRLSPRPVITPPQNRNQIATPLGEPMENADETLENYCYIERETTILDMNKPDFSAECDHHTFMKRAGILLLIFYLAHLPRLIANIAIATCDSCQITVTAYSAVHWIQYLNLALNPLFFLLKFADFKRKLINVLKCKLSDSK
ncbi:uncharacterized protein LOC141900838 [Tubulanus polymorphus]|uniref:uncharacterized protein LOC141900838 n=1 Tax=Tubulanus polymorphus TaxID=672921 RepID=UPI003DA23E59